jgi:hypothetical protein
MQTMAAASNVPSRNALLNSGKPPKCSAEIGAIIRVRANRSLMAFFDAIAVMASDPWSSRPSTSVI